MLPERKKLTIVVSEEFISLRDELSRALGVGKTSVLELAVRLLAQRELKRQRKLTVARK